MVAPRKRKIVSDFSPGWNSARNSSKSTSFVARARTPSGSPRGEAERVERTRSASNSTMGDQLNRGPSAVLSSFNSRGTVIDWLNGMPGAGVWNQPI